MMNYTKGECKFYLKSGRCTCPDAPKPNVSRCIGVEGCGSFEYLNPDARLDLYEALKDTVEWLALMKANIPHHGHLLGNITKALAKTEK